MIKKYGLSVEDYERLLEKQENKCAICNKQNTERLNIDHCHKSGKVRGLLCRNCNTALGHSKENIEILKSLIKYIEIHNEL